MTDIASIAAVVAQTARGSFWLIAWRLAARVLGVVSTVILVRLLAPEDFGLVALATSFTFAVEALALIDVEDAVTRIHAPDRHVYDTAFTLGLLRGMAIGGMIAIVALPLARFFAEPRLLPVILALGLGFLLDSFTNVGVIEFRRSFAFDREVRLWLGPRVASTVLTLVMAWFLRSYWALVVGILSQRALRVAFSYRMHPFRPRLGLRAWRGLMGYSLWVSAINVTNLLRERVDSILLGRMLGTGAVGVFSIGQEVAALPTIDFVESTCRAVFSGFSSARNTGLDAGQTWLRIIAAVTALTLPAGVGMSMIADPLVRVAFGARWMAAVPLIQVLGVAGCLTAFSLIGSVLLRVHGRMSCVLGINVAGMLVRMVLLLILIPRFGLIGAGIATALGLVFDPLVYLVITVRDFAIPLRVLAERLWRSVLAAVAMAAVLLLSGLGYSGGLYPAIALVGSVGLGVSVYVAVLAVLWTAVGRPDGTERDVITLLRRLSASLCPGGRIDGQVKGPGN